jgi:hypothetical protein
LTLGVQLFLFSFFGSVLGLKVTPKLDPAESDPS